MTRSDDLLGSIPVFPAQHLGTVALQVLIDRKEMLDLTKDMLLYLGIVLDAAESRVTGGVSKDLLVRNSLIEHFEEADRAGGEDTAGKCPCVCQDQDVERVAVFCYGLWDKTIVSGVMDGRMEVPIQPEYVQFLVVLVLADAFERNLNNYADDVRDLIANGKINKTSHLPLRSRQSQGANEKTPAYLQESSAVPFRRALKGGFLRLPKIYYRHYRFRNCDSISLKLEIMKYTNSPIP